MWSFSKAVQEIGKGAVQFKMLEPAKDAVDALDVVITSYSIHYTKLYEIPILSITLYSVRQNGIKENFQD